VDAIGGEPEAIAWLESSQPGLGELPVRDWQVEEEGGWSALIDSLGPTGGILGEISRLTGPVLYSIAR
jgi:hypothetical protein